MELTTEQSLALEQSGDTTILDRRHNTAYVLVRKDIFDRFKNLLCEPADWTDDELRSLLARSSAGNGWEEPEMEAYDRYDEEIREK